MIKKNPKIICGYSDITSLTNIITKKTGLVTFSGTNFKTIATDETDYSYQQVMNRFVEGSLELGDGNELYTTIREGKTEGELIGGNLSLIRGMTKGKYKIEIAGKILFLEELGFESGPALVSNFLYFMKQNEVFDKIKCQLKLKHVSYEEGVKSNPSEYKSVNRPIQRSSFFIDMNQMSFEELKDKYAAPIRVSPIIRLKQQVKRMIKSVLRICSGGV